MNLYFLSRDLPKHQFVGTAAWFFFVVNASKIPWYAHLDMINGRTLQLNAMMVPLILLGAWIGYKLLPFIPQKVFTRLVLAITALAAFGLLL